MIEGAVGLEAVEEGGGERVGAGVFAVAGVPGDDEHFASSAGAFEALVGDGEVAGDGLVFVVGGGQGERWWRECTR